MLRLDPLDTVVDGGSDGVIEAVASVVANVLEVEGSDGVVEAVASVVANVLEVDGSVADEAVVLSCAVASAIVAVVVTVDDVVNFNAGVTASVDAGITDVGNVEAVERVSVASDDVSASSSLTIFVPSSSKATLTVV